MVLESVKIKELKRINNVIFYLVNSNKLSQYDPKWKDYIGSHHWGKGDAVIIGGVRYPGTSYIPVDEIWVSDRVLSPEYPREFLNNVMVHEYIERPIMQRIIEVMGVSREDAWDIGHYVATVLDDKLGFRK